MLMTATWGSEFRWDERPCVVRGAHASRACTRRRGRAFIFNITLSMSLESDSTATARRERKEMFPGISLRCWLARWHQGGGGGAMAGRPPARRTRKMLPIRNHGRKRDVARGMPPPAHRPPMLRRATGQRESANGGPDSRRDCKESFGLAFR